MIHIGKLSRMPLSLANIWFARVPCRVHFITLPPSCLRLQPHLSNQGITLRRAAEAAPPQCLCPAQDRLPRRPRLGSRPTVFTGRPGPAKRPRRHTPPVPLFKMPPEPCHHPCLPVALPPPVKAAPGARPAAADRPRISSPPPPVAHPPPVLRPPSVVFQEEVSPPFLLESILADWVAQSAPSAQPVPPSSLAPCGGTDHTGQADSPKPSQAVSCQAAATRCSQALPLP